MGAVQCCEANDPQLRVDLLENRGVILDNPYGLSSLISQFNAVQSKVRRFGDLFIKKSQSPAGDPNNQSSINQYILQVFNTSRGSEVMNLPVRVYPDSNIHAEDKRGFSLEIPINDPNQINQTLFLGKEINNQRYIYKIVPFSRYEDDKFKKFIYEVSMSRKISSLKSPFLHNILDQYVIESGIEKEANDKCGVMIYEQSLATLHEIVNYRKQMNIQWTEGEFETLMSQTIQGLAALHAAGIVHRDIRHHNILYSSYKNCFMLGGFSNTKTLIGKSNEAHSIVGVPYFATDDIKKCIKDEVLGEYVVYNAQQADVYALGITLATSFFLELSLPTKLINSNIEKYEKMYPFLRTIILMLKQAAPQATALVQYINQAQLKKLKEQHLIESLRFKSKPQDEEFVSQRRSIAQGYYNMFMYGNWATEINEVVNYYELKGDKVQLADMYKSMGDIYTEHHQQESIEEYYSKASRLYNQIADDSLKEKRLEEGIRFLEKGIDCNRKAFKGSDNYELCLLLNKLAMAHHQKAQYEMARAFQEQAIEMTGNALLLTHHDLYRVKTQNSIEFARMMVDGAKIESEFQEFKQAENMLKGSLKIVDSRPQDNQVLRLKATVLQALGNNFRMKAIEKRDKAEQYRAKAEECILDALEISEKLRGNGDIQIAQILESLGNVYFDKRDFHQAKKTYQKSLIIKKNVMPPESLEIGQSLTYLANCYKSLKEYNEAIRHYDESVEVFRLCYGNDHNPNTAVAVGNIGIVYKELGKMKQAREYLTLGKNILKDLYGQSSPDYQYFDRQLPQNYK